MFSSIAVSVCKQVCTYERICMTRARFTDGGPLFNAISRPNAASSSLVSSPLFFRIFIFPKWPADVFPLVINFSRLFFTLGPDI